MSFNFMVASAVILEPPFFDTPQFKGSTRKGIKFWSKKLIINSAGGLGFRGTQFHISYGPGTVLDTQEAQFISFSQLL